MIHDIKEGLSGAMRLQGREVTSHSKSILGREKSTYKEPAAGTWKEAMSDCNEKEKSGRSEKAGSHRPE